MNQQELIRLAEEYVARGYYVFPCNEAKEPACAHWDKDATNDLEEIVRLIKDAPNASELAVVPGRSNDIAIDVDLYKEGTEQRFDDLKIDLGPLPETFIGQTPRGGVHYWYHKPREAYISHHVGFLGKEGIDVKVDGGYVCVYYHPPRRNQIAILPEEWLEPMETNHRGDKDGTIADLPEKTRLCLEILVRHGWSDPVIAYGPLGPWAQTEGQPTVKDYYVKYLTRPGKNGGNSGSVGYINRGVFYPHSSSDSSFVANKPYDYEVVLEILTGDSPELFSSYRGTAVENGGLFSNWSGLSFRWVPERGNWFYWDGSRWMPNGSLRAQEAAKEIGFRVLKAAWKATDKDLKKQLFRHANKLGEVSGITGALQMAKSLLDTSITEFDQQPYLINCQNGTLNLSLPQDECLRTFKYEDKLTRMCPWIYEATAQCPTWEAFLKRAMGGDQDMVHYIQKIVGYCLTGLTSDKSLFVIHGPTDAGKTKFIEALHMLLGRDYAITLKDDTLLQLNRKSGGNNDEVADLFGMRLATLSEPSKGARLNVALIKQLTGGGEVRAMRKYEHSFQFVPEAKYLIDTNFRPQVPDSDDAIWNRIRSIEFAIRIPKDEQDPLLAEKFRAEMQGVLAWAVRGWYAYQEEGLTPPLTVQKDTDEYRQEEDVFGQWIEDEIELVPNVVTPTRELYVNYRAWCQEQGIQNIMSNIQFGLELTRRGFQKSPKQYKGGKQYIGLRPSFRIKQLDPSNN